MPQESLTAAAAPAAAVPAAKAATGSRRPLFIGAVVLGLAAVGVTYWAHARRFEETDDAQIDGNISNVSPRVTGTVTGVFVVENQVVKEGDPLAEHRPDGPADRGRSGAGAGGPGAGAARGRGPVGPHHRRRRTRARSIPRSRTSSPRSRRSPRRGATSRSSRRSSPRRRPTTARRSSRRSARRSSSRRAPSRSRTTTSA